MIVLFCLPSGDVLRSNTIAQKYTCMTALHHYVVHCCIAYCSTAMLAVVSILNNGRWSAERVDWSTIG